MGNIGQHWAEKDSTEPLSTSKLVQVPKSGGRKVKARKDATSLQCLCLLGVPPKPPSSLRSSLGSTPAILGSASAIRAERAWGAWGGTPHKQKALNRPSSVVRHSSSIIHRAPSGIRSRGGRVEECSGGQCADASTTACFVSYHHKVSQRQRQRESRNSAHSDKVPRIGARLQQAPAPAPITFPLRPLPTL